MKNRFLRLSLLAILAMLWGTTSAAEWTWRDFAVTLTDASVFPGDNTNFGVLVAEDGTYTATTADDAAANLTVKAVRLNDKDHGWVNCTFTMRVNGPVEITLGDCQFGNQDGTVTDTEGNVMELKGGKQGCWHSNKSAVTALYRGLQPTTLTIVYNGYCPYIAAKAVDPADLPAEVASYTLTYAAGEGAGLLPAAKVYSADEEIVLPANTTLYKEGYTFTGWSDGTTLHKAGEKMKLSADVTLTAQYAANTVTLADRTEAVVLNWMFGEGDGAGPINFQGKSGWVVTQATIGDAVIDVKMDIDATNGKFNNVGRKDQWAQVNSGTKLTVPSCKGATIAMQAYNDITTTTIDGQSDYTTGKTISYTVAGGAENVDIVIGDGSYYSYLQVMLPKVEKDLSGMVFDNVSGTVVWRVGNEEVATVSKDIADAVSIATVAAGSGMTAAEATYFETKMVKYTPANSNSGTVEGVMIEYRVKTLAGLTFKPTNVSYAAVKVGTDNATYSWSYTLDGKESAITKVDPKPDLLRNDGSNSSTAKLMHSHDLNVEGVSDFTFRIYVSDCANNKNICIGNVTITGTVSGTVANVNMYSLTAVAAPEEAGTVSVYPAGESFEEGSEVTLTATENFGYNFVKWTDADGNVLSTEPKFAYTVNADAALTANFAAVETYELGLTVDGTNDYMVTINPEPTMVDGKMMYEAGQAVQLTANQYEGLVTFNNWSDGDTNSSKLVQMSDNLTLTAVYSQADIIAGWDFYKRGNSGRKADFASADNEAAALSLVETETGTASGWLDKSTEADGGY